MNIVRTMKHLAEEKSPFVLHHRNEMRKNLQNKTPSFLCPNCIGGILFHDLGLQFRSPTVNTMMYQRDFVKMVLEMDHYFSQKLHFFRHPEYDFPCAKLDDITVHFTHYHTEKEAEEKWLERIQRIDKNNLFVFLTERDGLTKEEMAALGSLNIRGLVIFTAHEYPELPYTLPLSKYAADGEVGNILKKNHLTGAREYEAYFDFVKWFNEADGKDYDISNYRK